MHDDEQLWEVLAGAADAASATVRRDAFMEALRLCRKAALDEIARDLKQMSGRLEARRGRPA